MSHINEHKTNYHNIKIIVKIIYRCDVKLGNSDNNNNHHTVATLWYYTLLYGYIKNIPSGYNNNNNNIKYF